MNNGGVSVVGRSGMLRNAIIQECLRTGIPVTSSVKKIQNVSEAEDFLDNEPEIVINAAGSIPAYGKPDSEILDMVAANAMLPGWLGQVAQRKGIPFIHVSTDCVFSGNIPGRRKCTDTPDPVGIYGVSKRLGEEVALKYDGTVIRTSFIGFDHGLLRWLLDQPPDSSLDGYANVEWTGSYVNEVARCLLAMPRKAGGRIQHLATAEVYTKLEVLVMLTRVLKLKIKIWPKENPIIYRGLIPTIEMKDILSCKDEIVAAWPFR